MWINISKVTTAPYRKSKDSSSVVMSRFSYIHFFKEYIKESIVFQFAMDCQKTYESNESSSFVILFIFSIFILSPRLYRNPFTETTFWWTSLSSFFTWFLQYIAWQRLWLVHQYISPFCPSRLAIILTGTQLIKS